MDENVVVEAVERENNENISAAAAGSRWLLAFFLPLNWNELFGKQKQENSAANLHWTLADAK
jgi:hypothetical protein